MGNCNQGTVMLTKEGVSIGGRYEVLLCGSLFYFRLPRAVWRDRIQKLKKTGYNCVDVYFPWNYHERADGSFDFSGEKDVAFFLNELKEAGIFVIARPGPYICSEWNGGGIPARILESDIPIRCADERFLSEVEKWYAAILKEIAPYTYENGGTVILLQLDNELDFFDCPDPQAYISGLRTIAEKYCGGIPYFCCAGQYHLPRAGALGCEGVEGTMNCYPDSLDPTFDAELQGYGYRFEAMKKPLLVSETNRDHFLLRRELSCGAKLLGAYNQVAGVNFDHFQAVNNWGSPDSYIMTVYDFESMIDAAGSFRPEAEEAVLFSAFLRVAGEALAGALPSHETVVPERCAFTTAKGGLRVLSLKGGGSAVCVPAFSEGEDIAFTYRGHTVCGTVKKQHAPFFLFGFDLSAHGIYATLTQANCEPVYADEKTLVFYTEGAPHIGLDFGEGEHLIEGDTVLKGVRVRFLNRKEAVDFLTDGDAPVCGKYQAKAFSAFTQASLPPRREILGAKGTWFGALGIKEGMTEYEVRIQGGELFVEHPCDMMRVYADGVRGKTLFADGRDVILPASADGSYAVEIEKWGHSNFDDSQSPALRTACKKGAVSFGCVETETVERCNFTLLDEFGADTVETDSVMPVRIGVNKWNSTRKPVVCAYSTQAVRRRERLILKTTEATDVAVYLDGRKVGLCDFGTFELTPFFEKGEEKTLIVVYRKRVWTQDCGSLRLLHVDGVQPQHVRVRTESELIRMACEKGKISLPLAVKSETAICADIALDREGYLKFEGKNLKVTCVAGGRVVGRLLLGWDGAPSLQGGDPDLLYFCPSWNGKVFFLLEALGGDACLSGVKVLTVS